ncbi:septum formation protein [Orenia metallireducens]|jgi:septum formation protein|uniref:dTTP/UTP pyrophosphatase n=1 Tax=Orenia metallireducens TaxID=1413210 RepID=A0A285HAV7_9FIRM|nr:Maf family protein [Orenia metallireducens]PRX28967.1 septum formation protein [Orenia metallireducens]SNY32868.1 septum formation protein [Orenia metallireducens]
MKKIILASGSPRRKSLLEQLGLKFKVVVSDVDESKVKEVDPKELVKRLSYLKATAVAKVEEGVIIAADTIVCLNNKILEKPKDDKEAFEMLSDLSGRTHQVLTGITVIKGEEALTDYEKTDVIFRDLDKREIREYISTGACLDKAGAYGIQDQGAVFVKKVDGCFYNVVGLSLVKLVEMLRLLDIEVALN